MDVVIVVSLLLVAMLVIFALLTHFSRRRNARTCEDVALAIESFLDGRGDVWDWDDFLTKPILNPELDKVRKRCAQLPQQYPSQTDGRFCNDAGEQILREYVEQVRRL